MSRCATVDTPRASGLKGFPLELCQPQHEEAIRDAAVEIHTQIVEARVMAVSWLAGLVGCLAGKEVRDHVGGHSLGVGWFQAVDEVHQAECC